MRSLLGLVIVLGACGDDGVGKLPDAPFAPDASTIDASTSGVVTLTVTSDGVGVADVKVYFQNADSTVVAAATTDASGVASATMEPGGFVTAKDPFITFKSRPGDLRTFAGVKPGDQLVLQQRFGQSIVNVNVIVPVDPNATSYLLYTSCGQVDVTAGAGSGLPTAVSLFGCGATADFVVETRDPNGIALQAFAHPDITLVEGGTIDLSADTYVAPENVTWSYTNVPAGIGSVSVDSILASSHGPVVQSFSSAIVTNGTATTAPLARAGLAGSVAITLSRALSGNFSSHSVVEWGPATVTYVLDMASLLLADYEAAPTFDAAAHAVAWTATGAGAQPDFVTTQVTVVRINDAWIWRLASPTPTNTAVFPVLPAPDDTFNPTSTDTVNFSELTTAKVPGGYDAVRAKLLALGSLGDIVVGATGRAVFQEFGIPSFVRPGKRLPYAPRTASTHPVRSAR